MLGRSCRRIFARRSLRSNIPACLRGTAAIDRNLSFLSRLPTKNLSLGHLAIGPQLLSVLPCTACTLRIRRGTSTSTSRSRRTKGYTLLPYDKRLLIVPSRPSEMPEVVTHLIRVGLDRIEGYLDDGMDAWENRDLSYLSSEASRLKS